MRIPNNDRLPCLLLRGDAPQSPVELGKALSIAITTLVVACAAGDLRPTIDKIAALCASQTIAPAAITAGTLGNQCLRQRSKTGAESSCVTTVAKSWREPGGRLTMTAQ
jgi:hypothetical protein